MLRIGVFSLRAVPFVVLLFSANLVGCAEKADLPRERPEDTPPRQLVTPTWQKQLEIGTSEVDTTLLSPHRLVASDAGVWVIDYIPKRILHFGHTGEMKWSYGREGAGPNELRHPVDLKVAADGFAWVLDQRNARITVLDTNGSPQRAIALTAVSASVHEMIPLASGGALLVVDHPKAPLLHLSEDGKVVDQYPFAWAGFANMDILAAQLVTGMHSRSGTWVAGFRMGDGFFVYDGAEWTGVEGWYAEPIKFPEVITSRSRNVVNRRHARRPTPAARSITVSSERLYVLFGGTSEYQNRIVDSYSLTNGTYLNSYLLPEATRGIAWYDGGLYTVRHDPYPQIAYWRSPDVVLP